MVPSSCTSTCGKTNGNLCGSGAVVDQPSGNENSNGLKRPKLLLTPESAIQSTENEEDAVLLKLGCGQRWQCLIAALALHMQRYERNTAVALCGQLQS